MQGLGRGLTAKSWLKRRIRPDDDGAMFWQRRFPGRPDQVSEARRLVRMLLQDTFRADDGEWVVGELAGNALRHTESGARGGIFTVGIVRTDTLIQISVRDMGGKGAPRIPLVQADLPESGMGLRAISKIAVAMGRSGNARDGHVVWVQLSARRPVTGTAS